MNNKNSIVLLTCYVGKLPWYTDYFLHSCGANPTIDFVLITDDTSYRKKLPENVTLRYTTLAEFNNMATCNLGIPVEVTYGYKLCDFKPAYGIIFADVVKKYSFWGHSDLDIIFGDIREFFTDELLEAHDLFSCRADWLSGCLLIYRNQAQINNLFTQSRDYLKVFSGKNHFCFDETNFKHDAFSEGKSYVDIETEIESMTHVVKKLESKKQIRVHFEHYIIEGLPGKLRWDNGKLYFKSQFEVLLYHMIFFKTRGTPKKARRIPDTFMISPSKIYF
jgi:hypothetical protein